MSTNAPQRTYDDSTRSTIATGVTGFAGIMLIMVSVFQILEGIAAIAEDDVFVTGLRYVYEFDVTTWGWVHLVLGIIGVATGAGILAGQIWAMILGIFIAVLSTIANFAFVPYYPIWSLVVVAFNIFVIWALFTRISSEEAGPPYDAPATRS
jgi:hypothetical protein